MIASTAATLCTLAAAYAVTLQSSGDLRSGAATGASTTAIMPPHAEDGEEETSEHDRTIVASRDGERAISRQDRILVVSPGGEQDFRPQHESITVTSKDSDEQFFSQESSTMISQDSAVQDRQMEGILVTSKDGEENISKRGRVTAVSQNGKDQDPQKESITVTSTDVGEQDLHQEGITMASKDSGENTSKQDGIAVGSQDGAEQHFPEENIIEGGEEERPKDERTIVISRDEFHLKKASVIEERTDSTEDVGIGEEVESQVEVRIEVLDYSQHQGADKEWKFQPFQSWSDPPRRLVPMRGYTTSAIRVAHPEGSSMEAGKFVWVLKSAAEHEDPPDTPSPAKPFAQHVDECLQKEKGSLREEEDTNTKPRMVRFVAVGYEARISGTSSWHQLYTVVPRRMWALVAGAGAGSPVSLGGAPWLAHDDAEYELWAVRHGLYLPISVVEAALRRECEGQKRWFAAWRPAFKTEQQATRKALGHAIAGGKGQQAPWSALMPYVGRFCQNVRDSWQPKQMMSKLRVYSAPAEWLMKHNCVTQECVDQMFHYGNVARTGVFHLAAAYFGQMWLPAAAGAALGHLYTWMYGPQATASFLEHLWWYISPGGWYGGQKIMIESTKWLEGWVQGDAGIVGFLIGTGIYFRTLCDFSPKASDDAWDASMEKQTRDALDAFITIEWEKAVFGFEEVGAGDANASDDVL